jgi:hypothetical protein
MKRGLLALLALILAPSASNAQERVLLRLEYYYSTNPEIRRLVGEIDERSNRELTELDQGFEDLLLGRGSARDLSSAEKQRRISETTTRHEKVELDANAEIYRVLERTSPYLVLECVVASGGVETALTMVQGQPLTVRVGLFSFVDGTPWLFASGTRDESSTGPIFGDEIPRPFPLKVPTLGRRLGFGSKGPVHVDFQRASLAPEYRPNGCTATQPGGEAPPPIPSRPPTRQSPPYYPVPAAQKSW